MDETPTSTYRGPQASPTAPERRELLRALKARAIGGDVAAAVALSNLELVAELRRARGTIHPEIPTDAR